MKEQDTTSKCGNKPHVVTVVFIKQMTVSAKSVTHALDLAEEQGLLSGAGQKDMSNWHAHEV